jgi:hypothetical protein
MSEELLRAGVSFCADIFREELQDLEKSKGKDVGCFQIFIQVLFFPPQYSII